MTNDASLLKNLVKEKNLPFDVHKINKDYRFDVCGSVIIGQEGMIQKFPDGFFFIAYREDTDYFIIPFSMVKDRYTSETLHHDKTTDVKKWMTFFKEPERNLCHVLQNPHKLPPIDISGLRFRSKCKLVELLSLSDYKAQYDWIMKRYKGKDVPTPLFHHNVTDLGDETEEEKIHEIEKTLASIKLRPWQGKFRDKLLKLYGKCMLTDCPVKNVLESAHIKPYCQSNDNRIENGLLLRADIHRLYDANLLGIDPKTGKLHLHESAKSPPYDMLEGKTIDVSKKDQEALNERWKQFTER